jgi:hypothetical protein
MAYSESWMVRLPPRLKPLIEEIARTDHREPAQQVRFMLERALAERMISQGRTTAQPAHQADCDRSRAVLRT